MEVNCENTSALAEGSRPSISASSSRSASILVLLWNSASRMRFRMDDFFAFATFTAGCTQARRSLSHAHVMCHSETLSVQRWALFSLHGWQAGAVTGAGESSPSRAW